jgi:DNA-binding PadR family transcriptional regulator
MKRSADDFLPLAPAFLHILLALAGEELHGYGIMQEINRQSEGRYKLGPGTLYDNLQRLVKQGVVEPAGEDPNDSRRRYYRLTSLGRRVISAEISRLEDVVREARLHIPASRPGQS